MGLAVLVYSMLGKALPCKVTTKISRTALAEQIIQSDNVFCFPKQNQGMLVTA